MFGSPSPIRSPDGGAGASGSHDLLSEMMSSSLEDLEQRFNAAIRSTREQQEFTGAELYRADLELQQRYREKIKTLEDKMV